MLLASGVAEAGAFKAAIAITESIQPVGTPPCVLLGDISGTGQATRLGNVTLVSHDCINPISETAFSFSSNDLTLTATNGDPNGDQIFATYSGTLTFAGTVGAISGGYQIIGGTGKFLHATGAGSVQGVEDLSTGKGLVQITGTIFY